MEHDEEVASPHKNSDPVAPLLLYLPPCIHIIKHTPLPDTSPFFPFILPKYLILQKLNSTYK